jgi:hypothetical protein
MRSILIIVGIFLFSNMAFATVPPPTYSCTYDQLVQAGNKEVNNMAKEDKNAISFVTGGMGSSNVPDPKTGLVSEIYFPYSIFDAAGHVIDQGVVILDGNCKFSSAVSSTDVHKHMIR